MLDVIATHDGKAWKDRTYYIKPEQSSETPPDQQNRGSTAQNNTASGSSASFATLTHDEIRAAIPQGGIAYSALFNLFHPRKQKTGLLQMIKVVGNIGPGSWVTPK